MEFVFQRKLYDRMLQWKQEEQGQTALLIEGVRRVGKSTLAETFAKKEYRSYILIDFNKASKETKGLFDDISGILKRDSRITKEKLLCFGPLILEHADVDKQSDFVEKLIPSEMIDSDVIAFISEHIDRLKDCVSTDEFKEKVKHLGETTMKDDEGIRTICEAIGIEIDGKEERKMESMR